MKIGVDAGCLGVTDKRLKVGVYAVVKHLLLELSKLDKKNKYYLYSFQPIERSLMKKFGKNMRNIIIRPAKGWLKIALPLRLFIDKPEIFLAASQAMPIKLPGQSYKTIAIFYDIAFEKYPKLYSYAASVTKHKTNSYNLAKNAEKIIAISFSTKKDLEKIYSINSAKIIVAYPGKEDLVSTNSYRNKNPYFLFVGAFKKSKNIPTLLEAFANFLKNSKEDFDLFLVGGDKWLDPDIGKIMCVFSKQITEHIHFLGFVNPTLLSSLYRGAFAFVGPSFYEGFGLPFLEAQSVGVPVIASRAGSLSEVVKKSGLLVNPRNVKNITAAMSALSKNRRLYRKLSLAGRKNASKYTWKLFGKEVQSAIENIA